MAFRCSNPLLVMGVEMTASAKSDTPRTLLQIVRNAVREFFAPCGWVRINRLERELTAARAEAEALRKALRLIAEDANLSVIAQERVGNKDSAKAWTVMRDRAIDAARSTEGKK